MYMYMYMHTHIGRRLQRPSERTDASSRTLCAIAMLSTRRGQIALCLRVGRTSQDQGDIFYFLALFPLFFFGSHFAYELAELVKTKVIFLKMTARY